MLHGLFKGGAELLNILSSCGPGAESLGQLHKIGLALKNCAGVALAEKQSLPKQDKKLLKEIAQEDVENGSETGKNYSR